MKKYLLLLLLSFQASAVVINPKGMGEFLLVPYYTVNNGLNTLVSVTNTTDRAKALKINFREGLNGHAVLTYNVYLEANDMWAFALTASDSTVSGYVGQPSALHVTSDESCAPFLVNTGQEFLPFELLDGPENMQRVREGYIEIIEMAEVSDGLAEELEFAPNSTLSENCSAIEQSWGDGFWPNEIGQIATEQMNPASGGLSAEAAIIDVAQGINYSIPVTALADFFPDETIAHSSPGDTGLSFDAAKTEATLITSNGTVNLELESSIDAASAVFMADKLNSTYDITTALAAASETVYIQPTRRFYLATDSVTAAAPFPETTTAAINCSADRYGGTLIEQTFNDRESNEFFDKMDLDPGVDPAPGVDFSAVGFCGVVFSHSIAFDENNTFDQSTITGSKNYGVTVVALDNPVEAGYIETQFKETRGLNAINTTTSESVQVQGIPVVGVSLQRYTNAGAASGLLAQYGSAHAIKSSVQIIEE